MNLLELKRHSGRGERNSILIQPLHIVSIEDTGGHGVRLAMIDGKEIDEIDGTLETVRKKISEFKP